MRYWTMALNNWTPFMNVWTKKCWYLQYMNFGESIAAIWTVCLEPLQRHLSILLFCTRRFLVEKAVRTELWKRKLLKESLVGGGWWVAASAAKSLLKPRQEEAVAVVHLELLQVDSTLRWLWWRVLVRMLEVLILVIVIFYLQCQKVSWGYIWFLSQISFWYSNCLSVIVNGCGSTQNETAWWPTPV